MFEICVISSNAKEMYFKSRMSSSGFTIILLEISFIRRHAVRRGALGFKISSPLLRNYPLLQFPTIDFLNSRQIEDLSTSLKPTLFMYVQMYDYY